MKQYVLIEKYREKTCTKCSEIYPATLDFFHKDKTQPLNLRYDCKICVTKRSKEYNNNHQIERSEYDKIYRLNNRETILNQGRERYHNDADRINKITIEARKRRRNTDGFYKFTIKIRNLIKRSIKNKDYKKTSRTHEILGCSYEEFKTHIENQFLSWMNWDNYGLYNGELNFGWDLDHIIPVSSALNEENTVTLNHYTNFQPLCSHINRNIKRDELNFILEFQEN